LVIMFCALVYDKVSKTSRAWSISKSPNDLSTLDLSYSPAALADLFLVSYFPSTEILKFSWSCRIWFRTEKKVERSNRVPSGHKKRHDKKCYTMGVIPAAIMRLPCWLSRYTNGLKQQQQQQTSPFNLCEWKQTQENDLMSPFPVHFRIWKNERCIALISRNTQNYLFERGK
jgi:hypothetical protein